MGDPGAGADDGRHARDPGDGLDVADQRAAVAGGGVPGEARRGAVGAGAERLHGPSYMEGADGGAQGARDHAPGGPAGRAARGAVVRLPGSTRQAVTDSTGAVAIDRLTEGEYEVEVMTSAYEALLHAPEHETVILRPGATLVTSIRVSSPDQLMRGLCPAFFEVLRA